MFTILNSRLDNGLKVMLRRVPNQRTVSCGMWVNQGVKDEDNTNNGISHLIEHLMFKTDNFDTNESIQEKIDKLRLKGARYNGGTTKDCTAYYIDGLSRDIKILLEVLSSLVMNKKEVSEEILEKEKEIVIREAEGYLNSSKQIGEKVGQAMWGNISYGQLVIGEPSIIKKIDTEMVNEIIQKVYVPENCVLVISGGFEYDKILGMIDEIFIKWKDKPVDKKEYIVQTNPGIVIDDRFGGSRSTLGIGFKAFSNGDFRSVYADILKDILVRPGSRLFQDIREKRGLVYALNGFASSFSIAGNVGVAFSAKNSDIKTIIEICMDEFRVLAEDGVNEDDLEKIKRIRETELLYNIESTTNQLRFIGKNAIKGKVYLLEDELREMKKVNKYNMDKVVKEVFCNENMAMSILGSVDIDSIINLLEI